MKNTELLYKYHKDLNRPFSSHREMIARALELMAGHLRLDQLCFFDWNPLDSVLSLRLVFRGGICMDLEEEIAVPPASPLRAAIEGGGAHVSQNLNYPAVYIPLEWKTLGVRGAEGRRLCVLRMERLRKSWSFSEREKELAKGLAEELAHNLAHAELDHSNQEQLRRAGALNELTAIFASSMRAQDGLRSILVGVQRYFGFDRVRLYLADTAEQKLKGELSADITGHVKNLSHEQIPLRPGAHTFADIVLGRTSAAAEKQRETVVYLPLTVQARTVGLLIVDNLLSRRPVLRGDLVSLRSFAGQIALAVDNAKLFDKVQELSLYDELTKLPLRRYFNERFQEELYRAERFTQPMALIWMDVDYFKDINDSYGHQIGDQALKEIGRVVLANLRKIDFPCRYGGDEILILLPQSRTEEARAISARLSREIKEIRIPVPFSKEGEVRLSVSIGVATYPGDAKTGEQLLARADEALYWVKSKERGTCALYSEVAAPRADSAGTKTDAAGS